MTSPRSKADQRSSPQAAAPWLASSTALPSPQASTAASAAITLLPGDAATPIAEKLADISGYFLLALCAIYLEKYLLTVTAYATFRLLVPAACLLLAAILSLFGFTRDGRLSVAEGLLVLVIFAGFLAESLISARREQGTELKEDEERPAVSGKTVAGNIVKFVLSAAGIVLGAQLLIDNGSAIASLLGVPDAIIAATMIAIGTSLPELVTSIVATKKGDSGLALGNAIGSNLFNILFILGMSAVISPLHVLGESVIDTVLLLGSAILLFVFARTGRRMTRSEGAACVLLYVAYTAYLFVR